MDRERRVRVCGKGYENRNIILRRKRRDTLFLFFAAIFGGAIYLVATALFHAVWTSGRVAVLF